MAKSTARDQLVAGAADMLGRRGLRATSVRELAKHSGAPLGSTYHYFPGGKSQLAVEAVEFADALTIRVLARELDSSGPVAGLRSFVEMWRDVVVTSDFRAGCPVLAVSVEEPGEDDAPLRAAELAFEHWTDMLAESLRAHGASDADAVQTATLIVAAIEGTVAMCRAQRSIAALDRTADALERVVRAVID
ncbi:helix-turn-helix domain-containing protein [Gordonia sp. Z-3]|uniref:TetR/AcrR family transcriptional regulator n=1 Tax=Gordonia tangerina TaxID=2911060 RepID=A0ABS9DCI4_9ACTN|nr:MULTISPECIES: helix-turn-helix domain-containing protein [Gordonia]MCF3936808.1 TetR/AcrR family transcriptional regulator [Gordonia tangerina]MED5801062.1 helix-turn-helix domain-containing protein [Gordonia sp. Z-3]